MKKERKPYFIILEISFILALLLFIFFYTEKTLTLSGFTILQSQPDSTTGKDTYIRQSSDTNYGTATTFKIGKTAGGVEFRSLIEFNLSSIASTNTVTSAILSLYLESSATNNNITIKAYRITSSWNETSAGWNNKTLNTAWTTAGGDYAEEIASVIFSNESQEYNFTITTTARGWVNESYSNFGILLLSIDAASGDYKDISSSNSLTASQRPKITVDYTTNAVPSITNISTNSNITNLKNVGEQVNFTIYWNDLEGNNAKALICNSSNISFSSGCIDKTFCNTSISSANPIQCSYNISSQENRTSNFWVAVCDSLNCSETNQSSFYMNHLPSVLIVQPNGGEIINQTQGNYLIKFNVSDADSDALNAGIYYSTTQNSTTNPIASNLNLTSYCSDADSTTSTANNCTYSWNSSGVYGNYFLAIVANDSYIIANDSSNSNFSVISIIDLSPPNITSQWIDSQIYSGKYIQIYANVSDPNIQTVWASINTTPQTNITMLNLTSITYNGTWRAVQAGNYKFKVYAQDVVGNLNDSMSWQEFNITSPNASTQAPTAPGTALPYASSKVTSQLNATDALRDVYAYLNVPDGFTFLQDYPQNTLLGNFTAGENKTATWFVSMPIAESTYSLNATYTDYYSNSWNSSSSSIQVTSAVGGYSVSLSGYPEVATSGVYYAESKFLQASTYTSPDSITLKIYDALGSLVVGPVSMVQETAGNYNYTYTVGASATEGQWETIANATKSSVSYYANQFWKVVGGIFDVRNITIVSSAVSNLQISVITENTGGAAKDLTLSWNLTRVDNNQVLDSGADTFAVSANSERTWTVSPSTSYIGQVKITFLGQYSGTEKAGAYKTFSTTSASASSSSSSGGGGGGGEAAAEKTAELKFQNFESIIYLSKNIEKTASFEINNTGEKTLNNIELSLESLDSKYYSITPKSVESLKPGEVKNFLIKFFVEDLSGEVDFNYFAKTSGLEKKEPGKIIVTSMADFFLKEIERLKGRIQTLKGIIEERQKAEIEECGKIISQIQSDAEKENFINAKDNIKKADECISIIQEKIKKGSIKMEGYWVWIITWGLILVLIAALIFIIYLVYRKISLMSFLKKEEVSEKKAPARKQDIDERIRSIQKKLGEGEEQK